MNSAVVGGCGLVFLALGVYGLVTSYVSERRRATMAAMHTSRPLIVAGIATSILLTIGGFGSEPWMLWAGIAAFLAHGITARARLRSVDDPPAYLARQLDRSMNPLDHLRHPVREAKATITSMNVRRNLNEHREWEQRHDIPHRHPD